MATFEEGLLYPLILLGVGGVITVGLGSWLSYWLENRRKKRETEVENHRKELEIKFELASKMTELSANALGEASIIINSFERKKIKDHSESKEKQEDHSELIAEKVYENYRRWFGEVTIIRSKLQSYFGDTELSEAWYDYWNTVNDYYSASINYFLRPEVNESLKEQLESIKDYFTNNDYLSNIKFTKRGKKTNPWENLTTSFEKSQWGDIYIALMWVSDKIIRDFFSRPIKIL